jgi:hypothetical protein
MVRSVWARVWVGLGLAAGVAGCATQVPPPAPAVRVAPKKPDWFHQQLALARRARAAHVPHSDAAGAQLAYNRVMIAACTHVAAAGPEKYRARCFAYTQRPVKPVADDSLACSDEDDTYETTAEIKACSD